MSALAASVDALVVTSHLSRIAGGATASELHVFSYLGCLLSVYDGEEPQSWSYRFNATPAGAPYAPVLADATDRVRAAGLLVDRGRVLMLSDAGSRELVALSNLRSATRRMRYLQAATNASTLLPLPSVGYALSYEPQLQRALKLLGGRDELLDTEGVGLVREHFDAVAAELPDVVRAQDNLLVPAVVWLSYLSSLADDEVSQAA